MTSETILLSTAYFPPVQYIALVKKAGKVLIEKEENFIKQTFRNRCYILTANGVLPLSIPVLEGSFHKRPVKDIKIDYSKRWQQIHLRGISSSYRASPFFEYFYEKVEKIITGNYNYLLDLNMASLKVMLEFMKIEAEIGYTENFKPVKRGVSDYRYSINPKNKEMGKLFSFRSYIQVFSDRYGFTPGLSALDVIFNTGPESLHYLPEILL
ncbi:MAG: WbqC family protein [Bacteroidales bacterium]